MLITLLAASACSEPPPPEKGLIEGKRFPAIMLTGLDGSQTPLEQYRGKVVMLNVWATWCAPCRSELPSLEKLMGALDRERFAVLLMSVDDDELPVREYLIDRGVRLMSFIDKTMAIAQQQLAISAYPSTFLISRDGVLLRQIIGARQWHDPATIEMLEAAYDGTLPISAQ
ncbi:MAG: TlpA family protein disulfide reductase [Gammaproteobacteria bacterium]|nr:TlpA family protein disulfide reductase [Gammaproteobacteria bacterium]